MHFKLTNKDIEIIENCLPKFTIDDLAKCGAHFGHKASRWNFEMSPYIFGTRNGMHIINLKKTYYHLNLALLNLYKEIKAGNTILFVATNPNISDVVRDFAIKCGQPYVTHRWLGGMLTNWRTIVISIRKIKRFEKIISECDEKGRHGAYSKKEIGVIKKELDKLLKYFDGLRSVTSRPDNIIVFDSIKDDIAIKEAIKLCISPTVLVDTNCSTKNIDYLVPCNNDSRKTIKFISNLMCETVLQAMKDTLKSYKIDINNPGTSEDLSPKAKKERESQKEGKINFAKKKPSKSEKAVNAVDQEGGSKNDKHETTDVQKESSEIAQSKEAE